MRSKCWQSPKIKELALLFKITNPHYERGIQAESHAWFAVGTGDPTYGAVVETEIFPANFPIQPLSGAVSVTFTKHKPEVADGS